MTDEEELHDLMPDFIGLSRFPVRGFIVTTRSDDARYDFQSRCFFPATGVNEDPVTGSAHCALAPYWAGSAQGSNTSASVAGTRGPRLEA